MQVLTYNNIRARARTILYIYTRNIMYLYYTHTHPALSCSPGLDVIVRFFGTGDVCDDSVSRAANYYYRFGQHTQNSAIAI